MTKIASACEKISDSLERFCLFGAIAFLIINLLTVMLGVFARFYNPPMWTIDLATVTLVWTVMLAAAPALKRGEHMAITIIVDKLPKKLNRLVVSIRVVVYFLILLVMIILGVKYAWKMHLFTIMSLGIKKTIPLMAIPVGMTLMLIMYTLSQFVPIKDNENKEEQL